jgi:hypothetical protein
MKKLFFLGLLLAPALTFAQTSSTTPATSTSATSSQVTCIQLALEKRENALISAHDIFNTAVKTALTNRLSALKDSWAQTDKKLKVDKRVAAYKNFRNEVTTANNTLRNTKNSAWKNYQADAKACGVKGTGESPSTFNTINMSL